MILICTDCGKPLNAEERKYYEYRCETCEADYSDRINAWREGADDPELESMFTSQTPTIN